MTTLHEHYKEQRDGFVRDFTEVARYWSKSELRERWKLFALSLIDSEIVRLKAAIGETRNMNVNMENGYRNALAESIIYLREQKSLIEKEP